MTNLTKLYGKKKQTDRLAAVNRRFLPRKPTVYFISPLVPDNKSVRLGDLGLDFESDYRRSLGCLVPDSFLLEKSKYSRYIVISG